jgi:hypothetical protein
MFGKIDTIDALAGGIFTLSSLATTGVYTGGRLQPGDIALGDAIWSAGGTQVTIAFVISIAAIALAYGTNRMDDGKSMTVNTDLSKIARGRASYETYIAGATVVLVLFSGLNILGFNAIVMDYWYLGYGVTSVQVGGYYVFSYLG